jgi:hypothetical protein
MFVVDEVQTTSYGEQDVDEAERARWEAGLDDDKDVF